MNKGILIGAGVVGGAALIAGVVCLIGKAIKEKTYKQVAEETGIPLNEVKAAFKSFEKELKNMKKNKATGEQINNATVDFYEKLEKRAAA
jgi:uncharacterized protein YdbL (DUF1318 family)